jgi:Ras family protein T1
MFDFKEQNLKPAVVAALQRIFFLCDKDQDSILSPSEIHSLQQKCFDKPLPQPDLAELQRIISQLSPTAVIPCPAQPSEKGLTEEGFVLLNKLFAEKGRHETVWNILRKFHYTDSLSLRDSFLLPKLDCPVNCSVELSPSGYRFFVDMFSLFDKDNDGALNPNELSALFRPTPGLPDMFLHGGSVRNEEGYITLQGWLAHWSMETRVDYKTTLKYLAYLGYEDTSKGTVSALKVTKARKRKTGAGGKLKGVGTQGKGGRVERNVFLCYVLGKQGSGKVCLGCLLMKTCLLDAFLNRPFTDGEISEPVDPSRHRTVVNSVETAGAQKYLIVIPLLSNRSWKKSRNKILRQSSRTPNPSTK